MRVNLLVAMPMMLVALNTWLPSVARAQGAGAGDPDIALAVLSGGLSDCDSVPLQCSAQGAIFQASPLTVYVGSNLGGLRSLQHEPVSGRCDVHFHDTGLIRLVCAEPHGFELLLPRDRVVFASWPRQPGRVVVLRAGENVNLEKAKRLSLGAGKWKLQVVAAPPHSAWSRLPPTARDCAQFGECGWQTSFSVRGCGLGAKSLPETQYGNEQPFTSPDRAVAGTKEQPLELRDRQELAFYIPKSETHSVGGVTIRILPDR